jgi:hypothetical protein
MERIRNTSQRPRARITGIIYLLYFLIAIFAEGLKGSRFAMFSNAVNLIAFGFYATVTLLFYYLFKPINRHISLIAALFSLAGCALGALNLFYIAPSQISPLVFFAPYCLLLGYLIFKSNFLPGILGVLMALAGLGWLAYLTPLSNHLSLVFEILGTVAEGSLMLWLIVKSVNAERWLKQGQSIGIKQ